VLFFPITIYQHPRLYRYLFLEARKELDENGAKRYGNRYCCKNKPIDSESSTEVVLYEDNSCSVGDVWQVMVPMPEVLEQAQLNLI
jgi:hypothetical protein